MDFNYVRMQTIHKPTKTKMKFVELAQIKVIYHFNSTWDIKQELVLMVQR
jgi:hypothetical protein